MSNNLNLMDYPGDTPPFQPGDTVECIEDRRPYFYYENWTRDSGIKIGDNLTITAIEKGKGKWQWGIRFEGKKCTHSARLFRKVEGGEK